MLLDHHLYGEDPAGYLLTNVALHAIATLLLYFAFARMTKAVWPSAFVAAVFAIHPLHVESVAWMSERKDVLSGVFFAFTLLAYARWAERRTPFRYLIVLLGLMLGLMSKPSVVTLPFVLLLLDYWPLGRMRGDAGGGLPDPKLLRRAVLEKLPLFAAVAVVSAVTVTLHRSASVGVPADLYTLGTRVSNSLVAYVTYLHQSVWPVGLAAFYPHPGDAVSLGWAAGSAVAIAALTFLTVRACATRPFYSVGWFWFLGTLVPMIGLVQVGVQAHADRYMYLPLIGLAVALAFGAEREFGGRRGGRAFLAVVGVGSVLALGAVSFVQVGYWRSTATLFERAVAVTVDNAFAHSSLGAAYQDEERIEEAEAQLEKAIALKPGWAVPRIRLGDLFAEQRRFEEAIPHYERTLESQPWNARVRINLGQALIRLQRYEEARIQLEEQQKQSGRLEPFERYALALGLARAHWEVGYFGSSIHYYQQAISLRPNQAAPNINLGVLLARIGRFAPAGLHLLVAVTNVIPASTEGLVARGAMSAIGGQPREAVRLYRAALRRNRDLPYARDHLAWILATTSDEALRDPETAIRLAETAQREGVLHPIRLDTLAAAYAAAGRFPEALEAGERALEGQVVGKYETSLRERAALYAVGKSYVEKIPEAAQRKKSPTP